MELSRPYQVLLAAAAVLAVLWFVALKPSTNGASSSPSAQASQTRGTAIPGGLGNAVTKAQAAAAQSAGANSRRAAAQAAASGQPSPSTPPAGGSSGTSSAPGTPQSTPAVSGSASASSAPLHVPAPSAPAPRAQVIVLLFYNPRSADDQEVRRELRTVSIGGARVDRRVVPISELYRYRTITGPIAVTQSPTLLVISRRLGVQEMTGLVDRSNIEQAIHDALAA